MGVGVAFGSIRPCSLRPGTCLLVEVKKKLDLKLGAPSVLGTSVSLHNSAVKNKLQSPFSS